MAKPNSTPDVESAVDDVRRVREQFARESGGDLRRHVEQTRAAFQQVQAELQLPTVTPPATAAAGQ